MSERSYLDWNATAPLRPEAAAALARVSGETGNPSSVHAEGRAARALVEEARAQVAALVGARAENVTFTSGGTEANGLALSPALGTSRLLMSGIEHPSVRAGGRFARDAVEDISVTPGGVVDLDALAARLEDLAAERVRPLVAVMLANNETGTIQPVRAVADLVHAAGGLLLVDAVQAAGRIACDIDALGADLLTLSGHKLGGLTGVGALVRRDESVRPEAVVTGGGQERGQRAGTENVPGIVAFGAAAAAARAMLEPEQARLAALRARLEAGILAITPEARIFGAEGPRVPNTTLFSAPGLKAETAVIGFDLAGVAVSSGAACSSGKVQPSHVLAAMGVPPALARGAVRLSLGWSSAESDVDHVLEAWIKLAGALLKRSRGIAA